MAMYCYLFIFAIGAERPVELVVSRRNAEWSLANGGKEFGRGHYPVMVSSTIVRWWCAAVLGRHWNPGVIVIPDAPLVRRGPYRWIHHPNYTAVVAEVAALPSAANTAVLNVRIRTENLALGYA